MLRLVVLTVPSKPFVQPFLWTTVTRAAVGGCVVFAAVRVFNVSVVLTVVLVSVFVVAFCWAFLPAYT